MELQFDKTKNIAYIKLSGLLSKKDIANAFDQCVSDIRYDKGMARLWDFRDADLSSFDYEDVNEMSQYPLKFSSGINDVKVAFVTKRDLEFGLSRVFEMLSQAKTTISVFRSIDEAEKWLMD